MINDDLGYMTAEVITGSGISELLKNPHGIIKEIKHFSGDSAHIIKAYADVDFFYMQNTAFYQKRKYRYHTRARRWIRFDKQLLRTNPQK